jgi:hypothetical protein
MSKATEVPGRLDSPLSEGLGLTPRDDEHPYTYASTQATNCAGCGEYKHTPLRIDAMGGYVCLTCIDRRLSTLLGEFGYPAPQEPLPDECIAALVLRTVYDGDASTPYLLPAPLSRSMGSGLTVRISGRQRR